MGQLILSLGEKKVCIPKELDELTKNGFISAQYNFEEIKRMISQSSLSKKLNLKYADNYK